MPGSGRAWSWVSATGTCPLCGGQLIERQSSVVVDVTVGFLVGHPLCVMAWSARETRGG